MNVMLCYAMLAKIWSWEEHFIGKWSCEIVSRLFSRPTLLPSEGVRDLRAYRLAAGV